MKRSEWLKGLIDAEEVYNSYGVIGLEEVCRDMDLLPSYTEYERGFFDYLKHKKETNNV